jgi:hypothetical protein
MLAVRLIGGLGNQMFQYAYGRCLAAKHNQELVLDLSTLGARSFGTPRDYSLGIFNITAELASFMEIMKRSSFALHAVELESGFHQDLLHLPPLPGLYLDGFWQSERYFEPVCDLIRADFKFKQGFHSYAALLHDIQPRVPVSLHVRRTDYLNRGALTPFVGLEYYRSAIKLIAARVSMPHFLIFSDDLDWCRKNLDLKLPHTFICHSGPPHEAAAKDLNLMTACQHFIIANSTFSWWGAWLGSGVNKVVVAPQSWFRADKGFRSEDIVPCGWLRV